MIKILTRSDPMTFYAGTTVGRLGCQFVYLFISAVNIIFIGYLGDLAEQNYLDITTPFARVLLISQLVQYQSDVFLLHP